MITTFKSYELRQPGIDEARHIAEMEKDFDRGNPQYAFEVFHYCHENKLLFPSWVLDYLAGGIKRFFENVGKPGFHMEDAFFPDSSILKEAGKIKQPHVDSRANEIRFLFGLKSATAFDVSYRTLKLYAENNGLVFINAKKRDELEDGLKFKSAYEVYCKNWNQQHFEEYRARRVKRNGEPTEEQRRKWIEEHRVKYNESIMKKLERRLK